ncbi:hypothetical protein [Aeromicrobium sp. Sec7.5]|uniref:hypothetical protein n=1 Tax=Aeromicrobium sp. Sec7.5 TaxID=3121276 RepID=UPI002FE4612E
MSELSEARIHIDQGNEVAKNLGRQLMSSHAELLELERLSDRAGGGLVVVDRADDLRRRLAGPLQDHAQSIRPALSEAEAAYFDAAVSGRVDPDHARTITGVVLQAARETRYVQLSIAQAATSLYRIVSALPSDPCLPELVQHAVQEASVALDQARRAVHRVSEDLPLLGRVLGLDAADTARQQLHLVVGASEQTDHRVSRRNYEPRPSPNPSPTTTHGLRR